MINKKIVIYLMFSMLLSIGFPVGIMSIIFSRIMPQPSTALLVIGIVLTVLGFYGMPMLWVKFGELKGKQKLCNQIKIDNVQSIETLAKLNNVEQDTMLKTVRSLIAERLLTGYEIVDDAYVVPSQGKVITKQDAVKIAGKSITLSCAGCGAPVEFVEGEKLVCPYCGRAIKK